MDQNPYQSPEKIPPLARRPLWQRMKDIAPAIITGAIAVWLGVTLIGILIALAIPLIRRIHGN